MCKTPTDFDPPTDNPGKLCFCGCNKLIGDNPGDNPWCEKVESIIIWTVNLCMRFTPVIDREDQMQNARIRILIKKDQIRGMENVLGCIVQITKHVCHDYFRYQNERKNILLPPLDESEPVRKIDELVRDQDKFIDPIICRIILEKSLTSEELQLLNLWLEKRSQKEIAEFLGTAPGTAGVRIHRLITKVRKIFEQ